MIRAGLRADLGHVGELHAARRRRPSASRSRAILRRGTTTRTGSRAPTPSRMNGSDAGDEAVVARVEQRLVAESCRRPGLEAFCRCRHFRSPEARRPRQTRGMVARQLGRGVVTPARPARRARTAPMPRPTLVARRAPGSARPASALPLDDLGIDGAQPPARAPRHDEHRADGLVAMDERSGECGGAGLVGARVALEFRGAAGVQHPREQDAVLRERLPYGQAHLGHHGGGPWVVRIAQVERGTTTCSTSAMRRRSIVARSARLALGFTAQVTSPSDANPRAHMSFHPSMITPSVRLNRQGGGAPKWRRSCVDTDKPSMAVRWTA